MSQIFLKILKTEMLLLIYICYLLWKVNCLQKENVGYKGVVFPKTKFVNIFDFVKYELIFR